MSMQTMQITTICVDIKKSDSKVIYCLDKSSLIREDYTSTSLSTNRQQLHPWRRFHLKVQLMGSRLFNKKDKELYPPACIYKREFLLTCSPTYWVTDDHCEKSDLIDVFIVKGITINHLINEKNASRCFRCIRCFDI